ncbi:MAG: isochorismate synthase [Prevotella sp.]|nr:isochorismate synthase [Prevotella sp.]
MRSFALYRFPHQDHYIQIKGKATTLPDLTSLGECSGFVVAPFAVSPDTPIVLINPSDIYINKVDSTSMENEDAPSTITTNSDKTQYLRDFAIFHDRLASGEFTKIVLARTSSAYCSSTPMQLFTRACNLYPRMFIALVSTPYTGTWLAATPEVLLEKASERWRTMALAGTMRVGDIEWSQKNIEEQRIVAQYISRCLGTYADHFSEEGPYAVRAGGLVHLRSDFTFKLKSPSDFGNLVAALHPTPAVCGLPKDDTYKFIIANESINRKYYSGFMGPINIIDNTRLYVTLRCMHIQDNNICTLYAGGGLMKESLAENEWAETEDKMETMKRLLLE